MSETPAQLLRIATAGSVDDGKSTLIGRLLWDSKSVLDDTMASVERASERRGDARTDLALLTDGLRAEREQGITIDVAYRYFATPQRSFVLADTPGHVQYTRNMVTGASRADVALILVDARKGLVEQSRRHACLAALLRVPHLVLCINKMDLVGFDESVFDDIAADFASFTSTLDVADVVAIPISALDGDNVVTRSPNMPWYAGPALLEHLEQVPLGVPSGSARFPVQYVIRPMGSDYRGYAGQLTSGSLRRGDEVVVLPSGRRTTIAAIDTFDGEVDVAIAPQSVTLRLAEELDVSRGDVIAPAADLPEITRDLLATVCWMSDDPVRDGDRYLVKHGTRTTRAIVRRVGPRLDVTTLQSEPVTQLGLNDIGELRLTTADLLAVDDYGDDRTTGSFIVIDEVSGATVAAGLVRGGAAA